MTTGQITNPHGAVGIWNYKDRITSAGAQEPNVIEQVIISSASLKSISTRKMKNQPAGSFELRLAPTFNWVARITPGSWCVILMSRDKSLVSSSTKSIPPCTRDSVKMFGRIHSVRAAVSVDKKNRVHSFW